jgi:hypothetical protein
MLQIISIKKTKRNEHPKECAMQELYASVPKKEDKLRLFKEKKKGLSER